MRQKHEQGDSGGPLVLGNKLVGTVSFSYRGCATGYPDGYARISKIHDWFEKTMALNDDNQDLLTSKQN